VFLDHFDDSVETLFYLAPNKIHFRWQFRLVGFVQSKQMTSHTWTLYQTEDGNHHYCNNLTKESTWAQPNGFIESKCTISKQVRKILSKTHIHGDWYAIKTNTNDVFYHNMKLNSSQWEKPTVEITNEYFPRSTHDIESERGFNHSRICWVIPK
jgi:hypothetical protein